MLPCSWWKGSMEISTGARTSGATESLVIPEQVPDSSLTGTNVFVQNFWSFHTDAAQAAGSHCGGHQVRLATPWRAVQQQTSPQTQRCPAPCNVMH